MRAWMYRWNDGTTSVVFAESKMHALDILDELGEASIAGLRPIKAGAIHFTVGTGGFEVEGFSEELHVPLWSNYPLVDALIDKHEFEISQVPPDLLQEAIKAEASRVDQPRDEAKTPAGKELQRTMGLTGALADRWGLELIDARKA